MFHTVAAGRVIATIASLAMHSGTAASSAGITVGMVQATAFRAATLIASMARTTSSVTLIADSRRAEFASPN